jgi:hypothetical protein
MPTAVLPADDKKVKSTHRKTLLRDAKFLQHFQAVRQSDAKSKVEALSVARTLKPYTLTNQSPQALKNLVAKYTAPAQWRDVSDPLRLLYLHHACTSSGPTIAFSLNLSPKIEEKARQQKSAAGWLLRRIMREPGHLDRPFVWFVLEETDEGRLHLHGEIVGPEHAVSLLREALRRAGSIEKARGWAKQADLVLDATEGWTAYLGKRMALARKPNARSRYVFDRSFSGDWIAASQPVKRLAKRLFEADREKVMQRLSGTGTQGATSTPSRPQTTGTLAKVAPRFPTTVSTRRRSRNYLWHSQIILLSGNT